ncbi:MAG: 3-hydroxy-3-methylglutaryl CoA synthase, partial [Chloroflexi bacterium]|nr:3-hydroxy-3-methylglutaryl CoA synthase [Chloroflexota bacterium]
MVGITAYGAYIPIWRLSRAAISKGAAGEKALANFDEDSISMAVGAAMDCLTDKHRETIDACFFASTTSPYKEKMAAPVVAEAADLRPDVYAADFANSLRSGTAALRAAVDAVKSGSARQVLVVAADTRIGMPGSDFEQNLADGAVAVVVGSDGVAASLDAVHSITNEMMDAWRVDGDTFVRSWEDRFVVGEGYVRQTQKVLTELAKKCELSPKAITKAVIYAPDARRHREVAGSLGLDLKTQVQDPLFDKLGNTGAAFALMQLVAALEQAKAGDRLVLGNYGDGADAFLFHVTEHNAKAGGHRGLKGHIASRKPVDDYRTYLRWKGLLNTEAVRRPMVEPPSPASMYREEERNIRFHGARCKSCGTVQYPPQRVCTTCKTMDQFETVRLSDKKGELYTYSADYLAGTIDI